MRNGQHWNHQDLPAADGQLTEQGPRHGPVSGTLPGEMCTAPEEGYMRDRGRAPGHRPRVDSNTAVY